MFLMQIHTLAYKKRRRRRNVVNRSRADIFRFEMRMQIE